MPESNLTFLEAAQRVLAEAGKSLHYREITRRALDKGWIESEGLTPWATMNAQIATQLNRDQDESIFMRVEPGVFALRSWGLEEWSGTDDTGGERYVVFYPDYEEVRGALQAWVGATASQLNAMRSAVLQLRGTPTATADWRNPDEWIEERLDGESQETARRTWLGSGKALNPRYTRGPWNLVSRFQLLETDEDGRLVQSERGKDFLVNPAGAVVQEVDTDQGLAELLEIVAERGPASRSDLLEPWGEHLHEKSRLRSASATSQSLYNRLRNLLHRGLVEKAGRAYAITADGLEYLNVLRRGSPDSKKTIEQEIRVLLRDQKVRVREEVRELLSEMDPYGFEHLIKRLLEAMEYESVEVTPIGNDKGVDVIANIQLGITSVREVIQAKRHKANVSRPTLDQLRGSLHRFGAVRGTIITTSDFSKGTTEAAFEPGAAPITLINGERLIDLLMEHGIGVKKKVLESWEVDADAFGSASDSDDEGREPD